MGINVLPGLLDLDYGLLKFVGLLFYPLSVGYFVVYCYVRKNVRNTMESVKEVCEQHSGNGTKYTLESEHWGGCNKSHVKRYFVVATAVDTVQAVVQVLEDDPAFNAGRGAVLTKDGHAELDALMSRISARAYSTLFTLMI